MRVKGSWGCCLLQVVYMDLLPSSSHYGTDAGQLNTLIRRTSRLPVFPVPIECAFQYLVVARRFNINKQDLGYGRENKIKAILSKVEQCTKRDNIRTLISLLCGKPRLPCFSSVGCVLRSSSNFVMIAFLRRPAMPERRRNESYTVSLQFYHIDSS